MSYYKIDVTMKNGFKYSYTCVAKMMPGMKAASQGFWVEKVESTEITKEEHEATWGVYKAEPKKPEKVIMMTEPVPKKNPKEKKLNLKFSSLENFFEPGGGAPENKKSKKRV